MAEAMHSDEFGIEFVHLSLIDSAYAKVIFQDVKEVYSADDDLVCTYMVALSALPINPSDTIRLFKVGWSSIEDYEASVPCGEAFKAGPKTRALSFDDEETELQSQAKFHHSRAEMSVTINASALPKDGINFYQFCYITVDGEIRGASTPFLFKVASTDDLVTFDDVDNDLLLIQTRTTILEENLQKTMKEKANIQMDKQNLEKKIKEQAATIENLTSSLTSVTDLQKTVGKLQIENQQLSVALQCSLKEIDSHKENGLKLREQLEEETKEVSRLMAEIASQGLTIGSLFHQRKLLQSSVDTAEKENQELNQKLIKEEMEKQAMELQITDTKGMLDAMEVSKRLAVEELNEMRVQQMKFAPNSQLHIDLVAKTNEILTLMKESEYAKDSLKKSQEENARLQMTIKDLHHRLNMAAVEYKQKYIDWYKLQKQVNKLQIKIKNTADSTDTQTGSSEDSKQTGDHKYDENSDQACNLSQNHSGIINSMKDSSQPHTSIMNVEHKRALIAEMEKQLQKFQSSNNSPNFPADGASCYNMEPNLMPGFAALSYPYPPFYPYPYPTPCNPRCHQQPPPVQRRSEEELPINCNPLVPGQEQTKVIHGTPKDTDAPHASGQHNMDNSVHVQQSEHETLHIHCPVCGLQYPPHEDIAIVQEHIEDHFVLRCPICSLQFERDTQQKAYRIHVTSHID